MKRARVPALVAAALLAACEGNGPGTTESEADGGVPTPGPIVQDEAVFDVVLESDITYAQGLGYHPRDGETKVELPLKLDVYSPNNDTERRPVFMWIHGGGFTGGSKTRDDIEEMGAFYAERGWVFVSINYRTTEVLGDGYDLCDDGEGADHGQAVEFYRGIAPQEWTQYACEGTANRLNFHQSIAMYAAQRDARAALRWVVANAADYNIDLDYITVGGNSAGAITASTLGIVGEGAFRDELSATDDPTLATTNLSEDYQVRSLVWFWGSRQKLTLFGNVYGGDPYDAGDPEIFMAHGPAEQPGESPTPYTESLELQDTYDELGIYSELVLLYCDGQEDPSCPYDTDGDGVTDSWGHGAWNAMVDGQSLFDLSYDFIVRRQSLTVE